MKASTQGTLAGLFAYGLWGLFPIYFKQISAVTPIDVVAWRIVLSFALLLAILVVWYGPIRLFNQLKAIHQWWLLIASTLLLSTNWLVFVYAIKNDQVLQSSMGYFLVPIFSVGLGILVFHEKPNRLKVIAVIIASVGMLITFIVAGVLPWISLVLGGTFGLYGMIRKKVQFDSAVGLFLETALLLPVAIVFIVYWAEPPSSYDGPTQVSMYLLGVVTTVPLISMLFAARRIQLSNLGFFQYITPCMHLLLAVVVYNEVLDVSRLIALGSTLVAVGFWLVGSLPQFQSREPQQVVG